MATGVGLRIAEDECTAVLVTDGDEEPRYIVREPTLHMSDDGDTELGGPAPAGYSHSITGFVSAVGDPAGISVDDGAAYRAEDLVATALFCLIDLASEHLCGPAEFYAAYPADWPAEQVRSLREALDYLGLRSVLLVSESELPSSETGAQDSSLAHDAARAALAAVLATPAGATPPDPATAENAAVDTIVIPSVPTPDAQPQAYSAALPMAEPIAAAAPASAEESGPRAIPEKRSRPTSLLVVAAALLGLMLGGTVMALLFRDNDKTPVSPPPDAKSEHMSAVNPPPPPLPIMSSIAPTSEEPVPTTVPPENPQPQTPPPPPPVSTTIVLPTSTTTVSPTSTKTSTTTVPPSGTTTLPTTGTTTPQATSTTPVPPTTTQQPTTKVTTTTPRPFPQLPNIPPIPSQGWQHPGSSSW
ncbi:hypothetical protein ACL02S_05960 [Nocardia sp. 004]|uniref:hypothetical protein n=1 Tax=Nocardia sp. 004 TaxID=3385978 RepID=UPI0039A2E0CB